MYDMDGIWTPRIYSKWAFNKWAAVLTFESHNVQVLTRILSPPCGHVTTKLCIGICKWHPVKGGHMSPHYCLCQCLLSILWFKTFAKAPVILFEVSLFLYSVLPAERSPTQEPLLAVVGTASGTISLYAICEQGRLKRPNHAGPLHHWNTCSKLPCLISPVYRLSTR